MALSIFDSIITAYMKCMLKLNGKPIGNADFINENARIIISLLTGENNGRGIIFHPGTNIPFYLAVILSTYNVFLSDESNNFSFLNEIKIGDLVVYGDKRGKFLGFDLDGKIIIETVERGISCTNYLPMQLAYKLRPYRGNAKTLDGRGIRRGSLARYNFLASLFNLKISDVKNTLKKSIVVVCDRSEADNLMDLLKIGISSQKDFEFRQLFPAAYYTSTDVFHYPGNSARAEPVVKFVGKISVARELILEDKNITTMVVNGSNYFVHDSSELVSLYKRGSLESIILLGELISGLNSMGVENYENAGIYAWTKNTIIKKVRDINESFSEYSDESKQLYKMLNNFIKNDIQVTEIDNKLEPEFFYKCKKVLFKISKNCFNGDIELFVIRGFSLLNLFQRAIFPLSVMEDLIANGKINALSPTIVLGNLENIAIKYADSIIGADLKQVVSFLSIMKDAVYHENKKFDLLKELVTVNKFLKKRTSIVIPKAYYSHIFRESLPDFLKEIDGRIDFTTPNKYNTKVMYDHVIVVGFFDWDRLNPLALCNAQYVNLILYINEKDLFNQARSLSKDRLQSLEQLNLIARNEKNNEYPIEINVIDETDELSISTDLELFTKKANSAYTGIRTIESSTQNAEILKIAVLETGEYVYFTKNYTPYVFDTDKQTVVETDIYSLNPGDILIFTNYDSETRDIVDKIMQKIIEDNKCDECFKECYRKSLYWKRVLREYMFKHRLSFKELSDRMHHIGKGIHEVTLRSWLDEDNYIVGPRDNDSYYALALLTSDQEMLSDPDAFYEACREVRSMRIRILKFIANNIIRSYSKNMEMTDELLSEMSDDIAKMSVLVQIESIVDADRLLVPTYMANRPHNI